MEVWGVNCREEREEDRLLERRELVLRDREVTLRRVVDFLRFEVFRLELPRERDVPLREREDDFRREVFRF